MHVWKKRLPKTIQLRLLPQSILALNKSSKGTMSVDGSINSNSPSLANLSAISATSPFGLTKDPNSLKGTVFTPPVTLISSAIYSRFNKIFSFKSVGQEDVLDNALRLWSVLRRVNAKGQVPKLQSFEVRSGASSAILGYLNATDTSGEVYPVIASGSSLPYLKPSLASKGNQLPLSFQVSSLDYDDETQALVSNYVTPLNVANDLNYTVFTPLAASEAQHIALLSSVYSKLGTSVNLYDGLSYLKESSRFDNALDLETLDTFYERLSTAVPVWATLPASKRPAAALSTFNQIAGTDYKSFEYFGHKQATTVFVIFGSIESELFARKIQEPSAQHVKVGVIAVRIPLPFDSEEFIKVIPEATKSLVVIGQSLNQSSSILKTSVAATVFLNGLSQSLKVSEFIYAPSFIWSSIAVEQIVGSFAVLPKKPTVVSSIGSPVPYGDFILWSLDNGKYIDVASKLAHVFSLDQNIIVKFRAKYDNVIAGGIYQAQLSSTKLNSRVSTPPVGAVDAADVIIVEDFVLLSSLNVVKTVKSKGTILVVTEKELPKDLIEFTESLPVQFRRSVAKNQNKIVVIDLHSIGDVAETKGRTASIAIQASFWKYAASQLTINDIVRRVHQGAGSDIELLATVITTVVEENIFVKGLKEIQFDPKWAELPLGEDEATLPVFPTESSFLPNPRFVAEAKVPEQSSITEIAKRFAFNELYTTSNQLRPDLPSRTFVVKVQENRRVTPDDYSRNIFHIEFDISGTGLTYDIGEALGVHGKNNAEEVSYFLEFYGLNPDAVVQVPNRDNEELIEIRTVFQAFTDNLDLLGKPGKKFYESLAPYATDEKEKKRLEHLASAAGAQELKRFQDQEFYSYSDVFELFPSAHPPLEELVTLIPALKRREYSIASSQKVHPTAVHLLIVVVDWYDARKRKRFGQCSRYLSELAIGTELVVSVKPSVMKLPPSPSQPIIMSGLGTGLAPFKAFLEEKVWQKEQGLEIGEIYLYLGARHKKEEYLYGELWEAYKAAGIITHIGAAFSRDQPEKIYIQDRIRQTLPELKETLIKKNGFFYLCGPTWPVPDISQAISDVITEEAKERGIEVNGDKEVEELKETGRYILEVY